MPILPQFSSVAYTGIRKSAYGPTRISYLHNPRKLAKSYFNHVGDREGRGGHPLYLQSRTFHTRPVLSLLVVARVSVVSIDALASLAVHTYHGIM